MKHFASFILALCLSASVSFAQQYYPGKGKTLSLIGQTWKQEFVDYVNGTGITPAGSSHYAEIWSGEVNQGNDAFGNSYLTYINDTYPGAYALIAISIKDNPGAGGYGDVPSAISAIANTNQWDDEIEKLARTFKQHSNLKFMVRLGYEVSLYMFGGADDFIKAYRKMHRIINGIADNVDFVYHPVRGYNDATGMYPGDEYVDWFALSVFNHDICMDSPSGSNCTGAADANLTSVFEWAQAKGKPLMIAEAAAQKYATESDAGFITYLDKVDDLIKKYDIGVYTYINSDWTAHGWTGDWGDSRVEVRPAVKQHWVSMMNEARYIQYGGGTVVQPTCNDGIQNGDETGVDCGGPSCPKCPDNPTDPTGTCDQFGVSYVDDNTIRVYHKDEGWSASWNYVCLDGYCVPGEKADGYYYKDFSATLGQQYTIEFKAQDNTSGQYLSGEKTVTFTTDQCSFTASASVAKKGAELATRLSTETITILGADDNVHYVILNQLGQPVLNGEGNSIDINSLDTGVYFIQASGKTAKFMKK